MALLVIAAIAVTCVLHSARFHNYVLATVQKKASESIGTQVQLQNFALHLSNLSLDLYGLTVHGAAPYPNPPLLQVAHAEVGVRIVSVLHQKWYLDSFVVDRPVVKVFTDAHGVTNIPVIKSSGSSSSNTSLFDLGIRHAVLDQGAVYYNNRQSVLSADLHNVDFRAGVRQPAAEVLRQAELHGWPSSVWNASSRFRTTWMQSSMPHPPPST